MESIFIQQREALDAILQQARMGILQTFAQIANVSTGDTRAFG